MGKFTVALIITLLAISSYYIYHEWKIHSIDQLRDPEYVYRNYLQQYDKKGYKLLAAQLVMWHPSEVRIDWDIYLYHPDGMLGIVKIRGDKAIFHSYPTEIDYSAISAPLSKFRELPNVSQRDGYLNRLYFLNNTKYWIDTVENKTFPKCMNLRAVLFNRRFKLVKGLRAGWEQAKIVTVDHVGGVFVITGPEDDNPLCKDTWLIVSPYNKTHDMVTVLYPNLNVTGFISALNITPFNGTEYNQLILKHAEKLKTSDREGTLINATGIYVNPHAREIFKRAYKRTDLPGISQVIILRNGTVKTWGIWIERGWARNPS